MSFYRNSEGYSDPTAGAALSNIRMQEHRKAEYRRRRKRTMTAKEFLSRAYRLDKKIDWKIRQVDSLNDLATKASSTLTGMPKGTSSSTSRLADVVTKIVDLQNTINGEIDRLVDIKAEITAVIGAVDSEDYRNLLELRYLCFMDWEQISAEMNYSLRWTYTMHGRAITAVDRILEAKECSRNHYNSQQTGL